MTEPRRCATAGCLNDALYDAPTSDHGIHAGPATHCYAHRTIPTVKPTPKPEPATPRPIGATQFARRMTQLSDRLAFLARHAERAIDHAAGELALIDSLPASTPGAIQEGRLGHVNHCRHCERTERIIHADGHTQIVTHSPGCAECAPVRFTATERAGILRLHITEQITQATDDLIRIESFAASLERIVTRLAGVRAPTVDTCDGRRLEGADITWTPHSRDPHNGWYDPTCRDASGPTGLCDRCWVRNDRWRAEHGLRPLAVGEVVPSGSAA